jgi:hypothetical protein
MKNILITENQLKFITEALGVPEKILDAAEVLFDIVANNIKSINQKEKEYMFSGELDFELGGKKKIVIDSYELHVKVEELDGYDGEVTIMSMGMAQSFNFDRKVMLKRIDPSSTAEVSITYGVSEEWEPHELYDALMKERVLHLSSIAHELKHKYDKQAKELDLVGRDAEYTATQRRSTFGIPVIDHKFFRYMYYTSIAENLVRTTEIASKLKSKDITKSQFKEFLEGNRVYKELLEIKNFTFDSLIEGMREQMDRVDALLNHIGKDPESMSENEKIDMVLNLVYVNLVNIRMSTFIEMISDKGDSVRDFLTQLTGRVPSFLKDEDEEKKMDKLKETFFNYLIKFKDNPTQFFKDECEKFNYIGTKMLKKISKLYAMAKDDNQPVSESIINWELHQKLMEKKYGKRKIETEIKFIKK